VTMSSTYGLICTYVRAMFVVLTPQEPGHPYTMAGSMPIGNASFLLSAGLAGTALAMLVVRVRTRHACC